MTVYQAEYENGGFAVSIEDAPKEAQTKADIIKLSIRQEGFEPRKQHFTPQEALDVGIGLIFAARKAIDAELREFVRKSDS